jgi:hypothetical protein
LEELLHTVDVPCMSSKIFKTIQRKLSGHYSEAAKKVMMDVVLEESQLALEHGDYKENETPLLTVIVDGPKDRTAKIILLYQVLRRLLAFIPKKCYGMVFATNISNRMHKISAVEADILEVGFRLSMLFYQVVYHKFIGDGDSSVLKKLTSQSLYDNIKINKTERKNHLKRNFNSKLQNLVGGNITNVHSLTKTTKFCPKLRRVLKNRLAQIRKDINSSEQHWKTTDAAENEKTRMIDIDLKNKK